MTAPIEQDQQDEDVTSDENATQDNDAGADQLDDAKDWEAEFKAQQRINRELERKNKRSYDTLRKEIEAKLRTELAKAPSEPDDKVDLDAIRKQAREEATAETLRDKALDKLEAKAARLFQNPEDARAFLADKVDDFLDGGKVDVEAITDALDDLLKARPYLGVTQGEPKRFQGTADGGPKGNAGKPQLSRQDVERLAKEGKHAEIEQARVDGRLNEALGIT